MNKIPKEYDHSSDSSASTTFSEFAEDPPNKKYKCPYEDCRKSFFRPSKLENHKRVHTGEKPFKCKLSDCDKSYHTQQHLKRHQEQFHFKNIKYVVCPEEGCGLKLRHNSLQKHILRKHNIYRKWKNKFEECSFKNQNEFSIPSDQHSNIFKCDMCFKEYTERRLYKKHLKRHREYECLCKKKFFIYNALRTHKKDCEFTRPTCNICKKTFTKIGNFKQHLQKVHLGGDGIFTCTFEGCSKQYNLESSLKNHIASRHMEEDKDGMHYVCCICSETLKNETTFWRHTKNIHMNPSRQPRLERKTRCDKNVPKIPMLTVLTGLPHEWNGAYPSVDSEEKL